MNLKCGQRVPNSLAKKGKTKFGNFYYTRCKEKNLFPSGIILNQFLEKYHALILPIEKPKSDLEWDIIISSLNYKENDLKTIAILTTDKGEGSNESIRKKNEKDSIFKLSEYEKKAAGLNDQFYTRLLDSIVNYMSNEHHLSILELCGLPLNITHIELLAKGLQNCKSIKILSLSRTSIKDEGLKTLTISLKNSYSIMELHLAGCDLTHESAFILTDLIKYQCLRREAEQWSNSLRPSITNTNSRAELFGIPLNLKTDSIKRLNICNNNIGDVGMNSLFEIITEDLGLEALDVQYNSITNEGLKDLDYLIKLNKTLTIFDLRNNYIDEELMNKIENFVNANKELKNKTNPTDLTSKSKEFKMLDGINPLNFSYHTKEIKITSNSDPSCEKLNKRFFPAVNPLLDKSKKKWSTFGPICLESNNKKKNSSKKNIKSTSASTSNRLNKVKIVYGDNVDDIDNPISNSNNNKKISNNKSTLKKVKKSTTKLNTKNHNEKKKFRIACIDDVVSIENINENNIDKEISSKNDLSNISINTTEPSNNNINISKYKDENYNINDQDYHPLKKYNEIADEQNSITEKELFNKNLDNPLKSNTVNEINDIESDNDKSDSTDDLKVCDETKMEHTFNSSKYDESLNINNITSVNENIDDTYSKYSHSNNELNKNSFQNEELPILENNEKYTLLEKESNIPMNQNIIVQNIQQDRIEPIETIEEHSLSVISTGYITQKNNSTTSDDNKTEQKNSINNEKNFDEENNKHISINENQIKDNNKEEEENFTYEKSINKSNSNRKSRNDSNTSSISSSYNESLLINKSNKLIEKTMELAEKLNKNTYKDNNSKQSNEPKSPKPSNSLKSSSKSINITSPPINNHEIHIESEEESHDESNNIYDTLSNTSQRSIQSNEKRKKYKTSNNTKSSNKSPINKQKNKSDKKDIKNKKSKEKMNSEININQILALDSDDNSEIIDKTQDYTFIKIPGNILIQDTPTDNIDDENNVILQNNKENTVHHHNNINDNSKIEYDENTIEYINNNNYINNNKCIIKNENHKDIDNTENEINNQNNHNNYNNLYIDIGNEQDYLLPKKVKNESKKKRELIYNTLSSLTEISDTIDEVENNLKNFNEEIIKVPPNRQKFIIHKSKSDAVINDMDMISSLIIKSDEDIQYTILTITNSLREIQSQTIQEMLESSHFLQPIVSSLQSIITYAKHLLKILNIFIEKKNAYKEKQQLIKTGSDSNIYNKFNHLKQHHRKKPTDLTAFKIKHEENHEHPESRNNEKSTSSKHSKKRHPSDKYKFYKSQINVLLEVMESMINSYYSYMEKIEQND